MLQAQAPFQEWVNALKHGLYTREAIERRRNMRDLWRQTRLLMQRIHSTGACSRIGQMLPLLVTRPAPYHCPSRQAGRANAPENASSRAPLFCRCYRPLRSRRPCMESITQNNLSTATASSPGYHQPPDNNVPVYVSQGQRERHAKLHPSLLVRRRQILFRQSRVPARSL